MIEPSPLLVWGSETICQRLLKPQLCHNFFLLKAYLSCFSRSVICSIFFLMIVFMYVYFNVVIVYL